MALTSGILLGNDMPNKESYAGPSLTMVAEDIPLVIVNIEAEHSIGLPNPDSSIPNTTYIGIGPIQPEVGGYSVGGITVDLLWFLP